MQIPRTQKEFVKREDLKKRNLGNYHDLYVQSDRSW